MNVAGGRTLCAGLVITQSFITCALARRGKVIESQRYARTVDTELSSQLVPVLANASRRVRRFSRRPRVRVAIAGPTARFKYLMDLPPVSSAPELSSLVTEGIDRFFLRRPGESLIGFSYTPSSGASAAVYDAGEVRAIVHAATSAGCIVDAIVTVGSVLGHGDVPIGARAEDESADRLVAEQLAAGPTDDYLAAVPIEHCKGREASGGQVHGLVLLLAVLIALGGMLGPGLRANQQSHATRLRLRLSDTAVATASRMATQLAQASDASRQVESFRRHRRSVLRVLAELAANVPDGTIVESFQLDSTTGVVTVTGEGAADVVSNLQRARGIGAVRLIAPVERMASAPRSVGEAGPSDNGVRVILKFDLVGSEVSHARSSIASPAKMSTTIAALAR